MNEHVNLGGAQPLVSVIVPVYKVEKYLRRCVDSILNQTYRNLEIILVDDGSPDNCGAICEQSCSIKFYVRMLVFAVSPALYQCIVRQKHQG